MIGFKELVQNFKDGLPELKDIGKEGLGILGDCAKAAGASALKGMKTVGGELSDVLAEAAMPIISTSNTPHLYESAITGEVRTDRQYIQIFSEALYRIARTRTSDTYIQNIVNRTSGEARRAVMFGNSDGHSAVWRVYFGGDEEELSVKFILRTPNAIQKDRNGNVLRSRCYWTAINGYEQEEVRKEVLRRRPTISTFLGVSFFESIEKYVCKPGRSKDLGNGLIILEAKMNQLLAFNEYYVIRAFNDDKSIGVMCLASNVDSADEFISRVRSALEEKYQRTCVYDDEKHGYAMTFYKDEGEQAEPYVQIVLMENSDKGVMLCAQCINEAEMAIDEFRREQKKIKDEIDNASRKTAIEAF